MSHAIYARGRGEGSEPEVRSERCYSFPGPVGNKSDMWSHGHIIQPAVLTCRKGSTLKNEDMIQ